MKRSVYAAGILAIALAGCDQITSTFSSTEEAAPEPTVAETPPVEEVVEEPKPELATDTIRLERLKASEAVSVTPSETGVVISGGSDELRSGGRTQGAFYRLSPKFEKAASGNRIRVTVTAKAEMEPTKLFVAYSTGEVGDSGWRELNVTSDTNELSFAYNVKPMVEGKNEWLGFYAPDAPVTITAARVEVLQ